MDQDICPNCKRPFKKYRSHQQYCGRNECQKARKAKWQKDAVKYDPEYKARQKQADMDWHRKRPNYWKEYRNKTPEKAEKNKILQRVRNQKNRYQSSETAALKAMFQRFNIPETNRLIAKMDVSNVTDNQPFKEFWLVPLIAKMDALKVNLSIISDQSNHG